MREIAILGTLPSHSTLAQLSKAKTGQGHVGQGVSPVRSPGLARVEQHPCNKHRRLSISASMGRKWPPLRRALSSLSAAGGFCEGTGPGRHHRAFLWTHLHQAMSNDVPKHFSEPRLIYVELLFLATCHVELRPVHRDGHLAWTQMSGCCASQRERSENTSTTNQCSEHSNQRQSADGLYQKAGRHSPATQVTRQSLPSVGRLMHTRGIDDATVPLDCQSEPAHAISTTSIVPTTDGRCDRGVWPIGLSALCVLRKGDGPASAGF